MGVSSQTAYYNFAAQPFIDSTSLQSWVTGEWIFSAPVTTLLDDPHITDGVSQQFGHLGNVSVRQGDSSQIPYQPGGVVSISDKIASSKRKLGVLERERD